jgi:hypothetical protein
MNKADQKRKLFRTRWYDFSAGDMTVSNARKYTAIAALGMGLALAATPASAQWYGWGGPYYGYVGCCGYGYAAYPPYYGYRYAPQYYYVFYHRPYYAYGGSDGYYPPHSYGYRPLYGYYHPRHYGYGDDHRAYGYGYGRPHHHFRGQGYSAYRRY